MGLYIRGIKRQPRGAAIDDAAETLAVAFAKSGYDKELAY